MATNDYRQDQTSEERDQEISRARRYGFQSSLGVEAPVGSLPEANVPRSRWGRVPTSGARPDYGMPQQTNYPRSEQPAVSPATSRGMGRSRRGEFGGRNGGGEAPSGSGNYTYNIYQNAPNTGRTDISGSTIGGSGGDTTVASGNVNNVQTGVNSNQTINQGGPPPQGPAAPAANSRAQRRAQFSAQMSETNQWAAPVGQQPATPPAPNAPQARQEPQRSTPQQQEQDNYRPSFLDGMPSGNEPRMSGQSFADRLAQAETSQRPRPPASGPSALGAGPQQEKLNQGTRQGPDRAGQAWGAANDQSRTVGERTSALGIARRGGYEGPTLAEAESNRGPMALGPAPAKKASKAGARKAPASGGTKKAAAKKVTSKQSPAQEPQAEKTTAEPKARAAKRTPAPRREAPTETETQAPEKKTAKKQSSGTKKAATQRPEPPKEEKKAEEKPKLPKPTNIRRTEVDGVMTMVGERDGKQVKMDSKTKTWVPHEE